ncbi:ricin-type beta-trefoil lectin domain protein [Streptacidiphilus jiangxiensis]|uniref:Ricin-type beta-trefoil lectin domain-containing protein n=1 Tax=Streptacidiphilus jiangxiensis TaxID=235985 RepID=A0A1H7VWJ1_STRJI|nr:ricin-type beta-trefoil lectin domain protein [Streptacidiphilus jiangxiensis]SEM13249.1 Ricin-type beta-trefoil lectin domain-containing protein [Streptacidiphilus jiangxiensis]
MTLTPCQRPATRGRLARKLATTAGIAGLLLGPVTAPAWAASASARPHATVDDPWNRAQQKAVSTGGAVTVDSVTTPTYEVTANPNGSFTAVQSALPVRTKQNGSWVGLDATLTTDPVTGAVVPKAAAQPIRLSHGGHGPLATLTDPSGNTLGLSLPFALPTPSLSGSTALYANVLPGVDLSVTVSDQGGFSDVLVVHNAAAAADPGLKKLTFATSGQGLTVASTGRGGVTASTANGTVSFAAPPAAMWDSSTGSPAQTAGSSVRAAQTDGAPPLLGTGSSVSSVAGPGTGAQVAALPVTQSGSTLSITPSSSMLGGSSPHYPVYVDPAIAPVKNPTSSSTNALFEAQQGCDSYAASEHAVATNGQGVGFQGDTSGCYGAEESFYQIDTRNLTKSMVISTATLTLKKTYSASETCSTSQPLSVYQTGVIGSSAYWDTRPSQMAKLWSGNVGDAYNGAYGGTACGDKDVNITVTSQIANIAAGGYPSYTIGLYGDESSSSNFTRFAGNPYITTTFDLYPTLDSMAMSPTPNPVACGSQSAHGWIGATTLNGSGNSNITLGANIRTYVTGEKGYAQFSVTDWSVQPPSSGGTWQEVQLLSLPVSNTVDASSTSTSVSANIGGAVQDGHSYEWDAQAYTASSQALGSSSASCFFSVDATPPNSPTVTTADPSFPQTGGGAGSPVKYAGDQISIGVSATDPAPAATCPANSANGNACTASGIDHFTWQFDLQPTADLTNSSPCATIHLCGTVTPATTSSDAAGNSTGTANVVAAVPSWGNHTLYVIGVDKAGNPSQTPLAYTFTAPWNPNTKITPGDLTGDGVPDLLATTKDQHLFIVPGDNTGVGRAATSFPPTSTNPTPGGDTWDNYLVAHRGSLTGGSVDDLFAYNTKTKVMYAVENDASPGGSLTTPGFTQNRPINWNNGTAKPTCLTSDATRCSGTAYASDWSKVTALTAVPDIYGGTTTYPDLITVEGNGSLWIYQTGSGGLNNPVLLGDGDWSNYDLLAPGSENGTAMLWVRDKISGNLYSFNVQATGANNLPPLLHAPGSTTLVNGVSTSTDQLCLADPGASTTDGTAVILWGCDNGPEQHFTIGTDHTIRVLGKCLATVNNSVSNGAGVDITTCNGDTHQQWSAGANGQLQNTASGLCLADPAATTTTGTKQIIWTCYPTHAEQNWNAGSSAALSPTPTGAYITNLPVGTYPSIATPGDVNSPTSGPDGYPDLYTLDTTGKLTEYFGGAPSNGVPTFQSTHSLGTPFPAGTAINSLS